MPVQFVQRQCIRLPSACYATTIATNGITFCGVEGAIISLSREGRMLHHFDVSAMHDLLRGQGGAIESILCTKVSRFSFRLLCGVQAGLVLLVCIVETV